MMKYFLSLFFSSMFGLSFSQNGQIISITTNPTNPTTADFVEVYVELMFNYGGCDVDNQGHNTVGNTTTASAHHCVGMLAVICSVTDTFSLGYLPIGNHQFDFTLSSGSGGPPCSPGIVPDDSQTYNFTVSSGLSNDELLIENDIIIFPNPSNGLVTVEVKDQFVNSNTDFIIVDITGREILRQTNIVSEIITFDFSSLPDGIYFYCLEQAQVITSIGKFVKE